MITSTEAALTLITELDLNVKEAVDLIVFADSIRTTPLASDEKAGAEIVVRLANVFRSKLAPALRYSLLEDDTPDSDPDPDPDGKSFPDEASSAIGNNG